VGEKENKKENKKKKNKKKMDEHVTRMDAEKLVKISRDDIPVGR